MSKFIRKTNYHTLKGLKDEIRSLVETSTAPVEIVTLGHSVQGRNIDALCFGGGDHRRPELLIFGTIHAMELIGAETGLGIIRVLTDRAVKPILRTALEHVNVWIIPVLNPDGYAAVEKQLETGAGFAAKRANANGVDLNRNFPVAFYHVPRSFFAGSPLKISPHYRGPVPCSEPESQVFRDFILGRNIKISLSLHSFGRQIFIPYSHTPKKCRDYDMLMKIGEEMAGLQEEPYVVKPSYEHYYVNGDMSDWLYDECGVLAFLMELGPLGAKPLNPETWLNPFYWANPVEPLEEVDNVLPACLHLIEVTKNMFA